MAIAALLALAACTGSDNNGSRTVGDLGSTSGGAGPLLPTGGTGGTGGTTALPGCVHGASPDDDDQDGFAESDGDCNDCTALVGPGAFDVAGNGIDEDCSGSDATAAEHACDADLLIDSGSAEDAARAIGLCKFTTEDSGEWGVISARFTGADGSGTVAQPQLMTGMLPNFGVVRPKEGSSLLALSSGVARAPDQPGYTPECDLLSAQRGNPPDGYPKDSSTCGAGVFSDLLSGLFGVAIFDQVALELEIRVPTNAGGASFESNFYSYEYPNFICSPYNDFFVAFKWPLPELVADGNVLFDSQGDPVGVNTGLLDVCTPGTHGGKDFPCSQGTGLLEGTGFGDGEFTCGMDEGTSEGMEPATEGAATGWLQTSFPVQGGTIIKLRFALWDTGDPNLDSTALVDNFQWHPETPTVVETVSLE